MTPYMELMDAVTQYYGAGSDEWLEIEKYGVSAPHLEEILSSIPGVSIVKNANGSIRSFNLSVTENITSSAESAVNSNVPATLQTFDVPATTGIQELTNAAGETVEQVTFSSGMQQAGNFVCSEVGPRIAAVCAGITLGKTVDKLLYNANPDFWDEHGMSTLDPDTWGDIIGTDSFGHRFLNMILGTTPDNKTQAYMDQKALAYMALYAKNKGVFNPVSITTSNNTFNTNNSSYIIEQSPQIVFSNGLPKNNMFLLGKTDTKKPYTKYEIIDFDSDAKFVWTSYLYKPTLPVVRFVIASNKPFKIKRTIDDSDYNNRINTFTPNNPIPEDLQSKYPLYIYDNSAVNDYGVNSSPNLLNNIFQYIDNTSQFNASINNEYIDFNTASAFNYLYGNHVTIGGIDGIGTQDGATVPEITVINTVDGVLDKLKEQFPGLFENAITQNVVQPDGTIKPYTYVPVAMPELNPEGNPISSPSTQANPKVDPETATEPLLKLITTLIQKNPPTNPPDTGKGHTPIVTPPTGSSSALYAIYNPTLAQINAFGAWLWSDNFVDQIKKLFNDPMQAIIGLHKVYATPTTSGSQNIKVGYLDSGVSANVVSNQYTTIDCGTVSLTEYFHNVFDYSPYTQVNLYLPFIGIVPLDNADVMRASIHIVYHVDVLSGACLAEVKVTRDGAGGTLYQFTGNASVTLPISSGSYMGIVSSIASIAGGIAGTIASGGAALPMIASAAGSALNARTKIEHSGSFSGNAGAMGGKIPYLIISRPQIELAANYQQYIGNPSNFTNTLGNCHGYTEVIECRLENVSATNSELDEINALLKEGVIV